MGGDGESDFTLFRVVERLWPVFRGGRMRRLWLCWKRFNYLGWSDLKTMESTSHEVSSCSLLRRDLHCSLGLVIKPDHLWGTESRLHINNKFEERHSQQWRLALALTTPSLGCRWLVEQGPQPQSAQRCHHLGSALLASYFVNLGRATGYIRCHLSQSTATYWKTPRNFPSVPCSQTTDWTETLFRPYKLTRH